MWMFCERGFDNKINNLHEETLGIAYKNDADFETEKDSDVTIHAKNLQLLMNEIYKTKQSLIYHL